MFNLTNLFWSAQKKDEIKRETSPIRLSVLAVREYTRTYR